MGWIWSDKSRLMPFFHALTGSDTTSQFLRHGKKQAWKTWSSYPEVTDAFVLTADIPFRRISESSAVFPIMEIFVCLMYEHSTELSSVNDQRRDFFYQERQTNGQSASLTGK